MKPVYISRKIYRFAPPAALERLAMYRAGDLNFWAGTDFVSRPRYGAWRVWDFADEPRAQGPELTPNDALTFESVTDQRSEDLLAVLHTEQCRVAVLWSGGIDSTVALAGMIRNWSPADLAQVDVVMNQNSYYENPVFYQQAIEPSKLRVVDVVDVLNNPFKNHIITDGEPADKLWLVKIALTYARSHDLSVPWAAAQTDLVNFFANKFDSRDHCEQYFDLIGQNIRSTGAPVDTVGDWFWWINFNWHWAGHLWYNYAMLPQKGPAELTLYQRRYHAWFNSDQYQTWSFSSQGRECKQFDHVQQYKLPAKQYIDSVVPNPWYTEFRTKRASVRRYTGINIFDRKPVAVFEDGSVIQHTETDQIQQLVDRYLLI